MKNLLIGYLLIGLLFVGCKPVDKPYVGLDENLKRFYSYKPGSYWVYKDTLTSTEDSFFVTNCNSYNEEYQNSIYEHINTVISSVPYYSSSDTGFISIQLNFKSRMDMYFNTGYYHYLFDFNPLCRYPFNTNDVPHTVQDTGIMMNIGTNNFFHIAEIYASFTPPGTSSTGTFRAFLNDETGLIKMSINHSKYRKEWVLQRYRIVR